MSILCLCIKFLGVVIGIFCFGVVLGWFLLGLGGDLLYVESVIILVVDVEILSR